MRRASSTALQLGQQSWDVALGLLDTRGLALRPCICPVRNERVLQDTSTEVTQVVRCLWFSGSTWSLTKIQAAGWTETPGPRHWRPQACSTMEGDRKPSAGAGPGLRCSGPWNFRQPWSVTSPSREAADTCLLQEDRKAPAPGMTGHLIASITCRCLTLRTWLSSSLPPHDDPEFHN